MTPEDVSFTQSIAAAPPSSSQENAPAEQTVLAVLNENNASAPTDLAGLPVSAMTTLSLPLQPATAYVSGTLAPASGSWMGGYPGVSDYSGSFSFEVNLAGGAISNAAMSATEQNAGGTASQYSAYNAVGGSGSMSGGNFNITGFTGSFAGYYSANQVGSGSYMTGSGNVDAVGGSVNGSYEVYTNHSGATGYTVDQGAFSGTRTQ
jgi:hypothetical protein